MWRRSRGEGKWAAFAAWAGAYRLTIHLDWMIPSWRSCRGRRRVSRRDRRLRSRWGATMSILRLRTRGWKSDLRL